MTDAARRLGLESSLHLRGAPANVTKKTPPLATTNGITNKGYL
jgi:hypothetical protein